MIPFLQIRPYRLSDEEQIKQLFQHTVHAIIGQDYSDNQVKIWIEEGERNRLSRPLEKSHAYVAILNDQIVGFADITSEGYLDRFYVHKDFQRCGIASKLLAVLESKARELDVDNIIVDASLTAQPFFNAKGYSIIEKQSTIVQGVPFTIFKMNKKI